MAYEMCCDAVQVSSEALQKACPIPFHEGRLWKGADAADLRQQLQVHCPLVTAMFQPGALTPPAACNGHWRCASLIPRAAGAFSEYHQHHGLCGLRKVQALGEAAADG